MSVKDGDMWGALTITGLSDGEIDAFCEASGIVDADGGRDFFMTQRDAGEITFCGNLDALYDALCTVAEESDVHDDAHEASVKFHEEFTNTFEGPA